MSTAKYTYRQGTVEGFDSAWDTPYGQIVFKRDSPAWASMAIDNGSEHQAMLIEALCDIQEILVMQTGKSPSITIS